MPISEKKQKTWDEFIAGFEKHFTAEEFAAVKKAFEGKESAIDYGAQQVLNLPDYMRQTQENQALRARLNADAEKLITYEREIGAYEKYLKDNHVSKSEFDAAQAQINLLKGYKAKTEAQLKELGIADLMDDNADPSITPEPTPATAKQGDRMPTPPKETAANNGVDNNGTPIKYVTELEANTKAVQTVMGSAVSTAQLFQVENEYRQLTGKSIENIDQLVVDAIQAGKPMKEFIQEKLEFSRLRDEKQKKDTEAIIEARVKEELAKRVSEEKLPFGSHDRQPFTLLNGVMREDPAKPGKPVQPGKPGEATRRATEAYYSGKYRQEGSGSSII